MDVTSPVVLAWPPFAAGAVVVLLGLLCPGRLRLVVMGLGGFVMLCSVIGAVVNIGIHAYEQEPLFVEGPGVMVLAVAAVATWRATHADPDADEDSESDGDGGSPVKLAGPRPDLPDPGGLAVDWGEFDDAREDWAREPVAA